MLFMVYAVKKPVDKPMNNLWRKKLQTFFIDIHRFIHRVIHRNRPVIHRTVFVINFQRSPLVFIENKRLT